MSVLEGRRWRCMVSAFSREDFIPDGEWEKKRRGTFLEAPENTGFVLPYGKVL
jgi:hypothetical protein